ncbi:MAG: TFIIB-type zinc ribbon-containing protein [Nitrosopumilus sp.]|nr:transcription initiation factor IIB [Nitrososphaerota archaeon]
MLREPIVQKLISNNGEFHSCNENNIITDSQTGEVICSNCGHVLSERVEDSDPEWRSFSDDKTNRRRTGDGTSLAKHDQGLSTIINPINKDASGRPLSASMKKTLKQLRMLDMRSKSHASVDRNFIRAFGELHVLKDKLALSNTIMEKAAYIYRKAAEKKLTRGRTISGMITAALYAACRSTETPRTLNDVSQASNIKRKEISKSYRLIYRELDLKMPVVNSIQCIARISSRLEITEKIKRYAMEILKSSQEHQRSAGKDPTGLAAAALYLACAENGEARSQQELADVANVTTVTIRNRVKSLKLEQNIEL